MESETIIMFTTNTIMTKDHENVKESLPETSILKFLKPSMTICFLNLIFIRLIIMSIYLLIVNLLQIFIQTFTIFVLESIAFLQTQCFNYSTCLDCQNLVLLFSIMEGFFEVTCCPFSERSVLLVL